MGESVLGVSIKGRWLVDERMELIYSRRPVQVLKRGFHRSLCQDRRSYKGMSGKEKGAVRQLTRLL